MTSNIGSQYLLQGNNEETRKEVDNELKMHFKPEFLNRIDEIVMFNSLDSSVVYKIIDKFIHELEGRLEEKKITLEVADAAETELHKMHLMPHLVHVQSSVIFSHILKQCLQEK